MRTTKLCGAHSHSHGNRSIRCAHRTCGDCVVGHARECWRTPVCTGTSEGWHLRYARPHSLHPGYSSVGSASDCRDLAAIRSPLVRFRVAGSSFSAQHRALAVLRCAQRSCVVRTHTVMATDSFGARAELTETVRLGTHVHDGAHPFVRAQWAAGTYGAHGRTAYIPAIAQ